MTEQHEYASYDPPAIGPPRNRLRRHIILFVLTFVTTTLVGASHYASFVSEFNRIEPALSWSVLFGGLWYSCGVLGILGAHEMGHYVACRYYKLNASLPYFLPFILPVNAFQTGTLGAVIRIRSPFPTRTVLFDVGVAGPIAGFVVLVPVLFFGLSQSQVLPLPTTGAGVYLGEPLLFQWATTLVHGPMREGFGLNAHPMVFASWFGMLATALNLLPFGQLDGGHITYAALGRFSTPISILTVGGALVMTFISSSWLVLTLMMVVMLIVLGPRHPRVLYEYEPLSPGRRLLAVAALLILALCFTPVPIEPYQLISER
jgi:membrane-associated protease RseP (regulator of RpoE activity)